MTQPVEYVEEQGLLFFYKPAGSASTFIIYSDKINTTGKIAYRYAKSLYIGADGFMHEQAACRTENINALNKHPARLCDIQCIFYRVGCYGNLFHIILS